MADGTSSLQEWYEEQDKKSPGLRQVLKGESFKVGNRVDVWKQKESEWMVGTIIAKRTGPKFDIIYDNGDEDNNVEPVFIRLENKESSTEKRLQRIGIKSVGIGEDSEMPRRATDQLKVLSDENKELTIKYNTLKEKIKSSEKCEQTLNELFKENRKLHNEKKELEKQFRDCEEIKSEIEKLKQERETHMRLIGELSSSQRATIKAGSNNKHIYYVSKYSTASKRNASRRQSSQRKKSGTLRRMFRK